MTVLTVEKGLQDTEINELQKFGKFHILQYTWLCFALFMVSMLHVNYIFIAEIPEYRCIVPECEFENITVEKPDWWPQDVDSKCLRPEFNQDQLVFNDTERTCSETSIIGVAECENWVYETDKSIVSAYNLGCNSWKASLVGTVHNAGMLIAMPVAGWLSDKIGRKPAVIICSVGGFIGLFKIFAKTFYLYLFIEFMESIFASGLYNVGIIQLVEIGGETKRVTAGVIFSYAIYVGEVLYALLAKALQYWKYMIIVIYSPMIIFICFFHLINESPRWQMIRGRMQGAKTTLKNIARINKINVSNEQIDALSDEEIKTKFKVELQEEKESFKDIFGSKLIMTRLFVTSACFFTSSFLYYGLMVNAIYLPGDKYTNFIMASVTSFPGDILAFYNLNRFGRKITLQCGYLLCAAFLVAQFYAPESLPWLKIFLYLIGKLSVVVCFTSIFTYAMELFPTSVRGSLFGFGSTISRVGAMLAPLTPLLASNVEALPSLLFASSAVMSAFAVSFTPETKYLPLFDTIAQVTAYKTNEKKSNEHITHL